LIEGTPPKTTAAATGEFITRSDVETFELGKRIGATLSGRTVFLLTGDLGAGKTVFAKGVAAGIDIDPDDVASPSFTLINIHEGRLRLYHIDLYRLDAGADQALGLDEILDEDRAVTIIEWAERLTARLDEAIHVEIRAISDAEREIVIRKVHAN